MSRLELDDTALPAASPPPDDRTATAPSARGVVSAPGLTLGQQLGHFRIDRQLGAGGMGEVYLATDLALDRPVAIKVLPEHLARDARRRERMIKEARAQARVTHPNVGHIYFIGEDAGRVYFAMEYVPGKTLAELVEKGPLPIEEALSLVLAATEGLREASRSGFTHRDVKPSNLMVDGHGHVKVLDFGLAAGEAGVATAGPVAQTSLAGTPLYMAPEQARGEPVDFRADIYALGATLYHLVAGKPPFQSDSVEGLVSLHATAARPNVIRRDQPRPTIAAVDALCAKMMAPKPEDRFASYDELIHALELALERQGRPAGFTARTIAFGFDLLIAVLLLTLGLSGIVALTGPLPELDGVPFVLAWGLVYETILVARFGTTLGKALLDIDVSDVATGARPAWKNAAIRSLVMLALPLVVCVIADAVSWFTTFQLDVGGVFTLLWFLLCAVRLGHASRRVHGKRTPWDKRAGTIVRYRASGRRSR